MDDEAAATMVVPVHRMTPYLRLRIATGDRSLVLWDRPSLFGFIPLRRRSIELTFAELRSRRIKRSIRLDSVILIAALIAAIFLLSPPVAVIVVLAAGAVLQVPFAVPNATVRIEHTDGRSWTMRFCRDYSFDVDLALSDAERRRDEQLAHHEAA